MRFVHGRRLLGGRAKFAAAGAAAIVAGAGVWLAVPDTTHPALATGRGLPAAAHPAAAHSATAPRAADCGSPSLAGASGAWLPDWLDDASRPSLISSQARELRLLDFYWVRLGPDPGSLTLQQDAPKASSLRAALSTAAAANACGLRFVTVSDDRTPKPVMAEILTDSQVRQRNIAALTALIADYPQTDGLTLDYEYALPGNRADLAQYAATAHWHGLTTSEEVSRITAEYTAYVRDLANAMHGEHRQLRVAVGVRTTNKVNYSYIKPFLYDYGQLAKYADQLVFMAIDFHSAGSDPGPIVTTADVASVLTEVRTYDIPVARIAVESAVYAYNWTVNSAGHRLAGTKAASLTATEVTSRDWPKAGSQDGETYYRYTADGKRHEVWFAGSGLQHQASQLRKLCPGCAINVWATGNTDPVGSALILAAVGVGHPSESVVPVRPE